MTESKKEEIRKNIKHICDNKILDVDFDEIDITFRLTQQNIFTNHVIIHETIGISGKENGVNFYISGDTDIETISKCAIKGYLIEREKCMKQEIKSKKEKQHSFLNLFR